MDLGGMESNAESRSKDHNWGIKWTPDEDSRLFQAMERFGSDDWRKISAEVATRDTGKKTVLICSYHQILSEIFIL